MNLAPIIPLFVRIKSLPLRVLLGLVIHKVKMRVVAVYTRIIDGAGFLRRRADPEMSAPLFSCPERGVLADHQTWIFPLADRYVGHRFNLLGSGWVHIRHGMEAEGWEGVKFSPADNITRFDEKGCWLASFVNLANRQYSCQTWSILKGINAGYVPIDWQIAFKTGFRWSSKVWNTASRKNIPVGVDIKEPWELSRMQHLPVLAYALALADADDRDEFSKEFQCQVLDFVAQNPPGFGVNWACPMDVAIRMVNWLVAYDFFRTEKASLDPEFRRVLARSVEDHAQFVFRFREFSPIENNNHYLTNLCGLIFAAAYLPESSSARKRLKFALPAFLQEVEAQFNPDGSNFEGSVSYHRLSAEMVTYTTGIIWRMRQERRGIWTELTDGQEFIRLIGQLKKMAEFSVDVTNPMGRVWQIGDNDNGRFFKLQPLFLTEEDMSEICPRENAADPFAVENTLNHHSLAAAVNALIEDSSLSDFYEENSLDYWILNSLVGEEPHPVVAPDNSDQGCFENGTVALSEDVLSKWNKVEFAFPASGLKENLHIKAYTDFGLYIYQSDRMHLVVRCGGRERSKKAGHMHEDQFSICLCVDGKEYIVDPGTCVYTPFPELRNRYRSASAHFSPFSWRESEEADYLRRPVFASPEGSEKQCLEFSLNQFVGGVSEGTPEVVIQLFDERVDFYSQNGHYPELDHTGQISFSCGYGMR